MDKIKGPPGVGLRPDEYRRPVSHSPPAGLALSYRETFFAMQPVDAVDPRGLAVPPQQDEQPSVDEASTRVGKVTQPAAQVRVRQPAGSGNGPSSDPPPRGCRPDVPTVSSQPVDACRHGLGRPRGEPAA